MSENLSSKNIEILTFISACPNSTVKAEVLRIMFADDHIEERIGQLEKDGFVEVIEAESHLSDDGCIVMAVRGQTIAYRLTYKGRDVLSENDELRKEHSEQERQRVHDNAQRQKDRSQDFRRTIVSNIISAIIGSVVTLVMQWLF